METLIALLTQAVRGGASDIHLIAGLPPLFRTHTDLTPCEPGAAPLTPEQTHGFVGQLVGAERLAKLEEHRDLDFSMAVHGVGRFRVNAHYQRESVALAFRAISNHVPNLRELNLPPIVERFVDLPRGLVLVTGQTGSGKSTTLAAMIQTMNLRYRYHIITLEDPVEYLFANDKCVIEQREVGTDVPEFASGLRHALRQDPDILLVGEMRDLETTSAAITAAETGHLVLSTLHTQNAAQTIERAIDIYPASQQNQIRAMLSNTLQAVISMMLFPRADRPGMVPACEIMICTPAVRNCIRENRIHEIPNIIATSRGIGMCTLDDSLRALYLNNLITRENALAASTRPELLERELVA